MFDPRVRAEVGREESVGLGDRAGDVVEEAGVAPQQAPGVGLLESAAALGGVDAQPCAEQHADQQRERHEGGLAELSARLARVLDLLLGSLAHGGPG